MLIRLVFALIVLAHGLLHAIGFAKSIGLAVPIKGDISRPVGLLWLLAALLFATGGVSLLGNARWWWMPLAPALLVSQALVVSSWDDAKFGTVANVLVLLGVIFAVRDSGGFGLPATYRQEVLRRLSASNADVPVTESDLAHLPFPLRRYLQRAGAVGRPRVENFRAHFRGEIRRSADADWMRFEAEQYSFYADPARLSLMRASQWGVPFDALHLYLGSSATMQVDVAAFLRMVDARGAKMNQSETVTMFNDMCLFAPATLIDRRIRWEQIGDSSVEGTFTNAGNAVSAVLTFDADGDLTNFFSDDRYLSSDGKKYEKFRWSTPVVSYRNFDGRRVPSQAEASWRMPGGEFVYARVEVVDIAYNVDSL